MKNIILAAAVGALISSLVTVSILNSQKPKTTTTNDLIKEFYDVENAVYVSPHSLRRQMDKGEQNYILVDLRSPQEYEKEHVISAINIPAYKDPNTSAYEEKDWIIGEFRKLPKDKDIIVYCYSIPCMTGRKVGKMLSDNGIFVKHLGIGWNEWRYFWTMWNHEHEWALTKAEDYVVSGKDPGTPQKRELPSSCGEGELAC
ncbi:rhodanese-like domain-containing protein [Candidatus Daviesbacteria bacterium]|nr:rhodanese-like domain-containing protein [Candidatus Daviesbacteria bacterium]